MYHRKTQSPRQRAESTTVNYHQHLNFLLEVVEFILNKLDDLCKWKVEQQGLKRKKSMIKIFDKNIDTLPNFKTQSIEMPTFNEFPKIIDKIQLYKDSIPPNESLDSKVVDKIQRYISNEVLTISERISQIQQRTKSLQVDMMDLISLYKDLL